MTDEHENVYSAAKAVACFLSVHFSRVDLTTINEGELYSLAVDAKAAGLEKLCSDVKQVLLDRVNAI